jgi:SAM-dependent methyltransferase
MMKVFRLFVVSVLTLLLELALIRYLGTELPAVGFFKNLVLIACFLGLGVGLNLRMPIRSALGLFGITSCLPLLLVRIAYAWELVTLYTGGTDEAILLPTQGGRELGLGIALVCLAFVSAMVPFIFLGCLFGAYFDAFRESLRAYGWNILGSLVGTIAFSVICFLTVPPVVWFSICALLFVLLYLSEIKETGGAMAALLTVVVFIQLLLCLPSGMDRVIWTPYYKVTLYPGAHHSGHHGYALNVNNTWFQHSIDINLLHGHESVTGENQAANLRFRTPFIFANPKKVLVLGSGLGNDTAGALKQGADSVYAVDIDPQIPQLSESLHPNKPYRDPRVHLVIDDARHFLNSSQERYDLILFGVLEARSLFSQFSNLRLDNYVYTREGVEAALRRLSPGGVLWLNMWVPKDWVFEKFVLLMRELCGENFAVLRGVGSEHFSFVTSARWDPEKILALAKSLPDIEVVKAVPNSGESVTVPTDDWPYIFFRTRSLPLPYILLLGILILVSLAPLRMAYKDLFRVEWGFFFIGAAFLLLESNAVTRIALVAGTTWVVNSVVFAGVLGFIFLANWIVQYYSFKQTTPMFIYLGLTLLLSYSFPFSRLLTLPNAMAIAIASTLLTLPILFAGMIFSTFLSRTAVASRALGSNILGAVMGGLAEYFSMILGNRAIALIALAAYILAWFAFRRVKLA